ncbi:MAG: outer membrane protein assembly factor BamD [Chitinophagaceae bacterium]|nr:outer membrane protein assembly factor BamD [Chitinophagaceae bacterium]MCB9045296.1 outer membrane protein assembly factor BamD [Chitinophagales bacterium]
MRTAVHNLLYVLVLAVLFSSCSGYERVLKSNDVNMKLEKANKYYEQKKYPQANAVYESLIPVMKNTRNYEPLYYRYTYTFYYMKDYISASYHFKNFAEFFPKSKDVEECEFMHAFCLFKESPKASLDQSYTHKTVGALQTFLNAYPTSKRAPEANRMIDACRKKLETKEAASAKLYYNIGHYKAASIAYQQVLLEYPESANSDKYQYMIVKAWYQYAKQSIKAKQEERYANALNAFRELKETYPQSKYTGEAQKYVTLADNSIKKLRNEQ